MPIPFVRVIDRSKRNTASAIVMTCLQLWGVVSAGSTQSNLQEWRRPAHFADTVMVNAPAFLLAVNETMLSPHAIAPLMSNATALPWVICVAP
jgi:hypothetical protein